VVRAGLLPRETEARLDPAPAQQHLGNLRRVVGHRYVPAPAERDKFCLRQPRLRDECLSRQQQPVLRAPRDRHWYRLVDDAREGNGGVQDHVDRWLRGEIRLHVADRLLRGDL
jgi:hypothetical protein